MSEDLVELDATAQAGLVQDRTCSAAELLGAGIQRIERSNPLLNAVITPLFDKARAEVERRMAEHAVGPLEGVPFLLKDAVAHSDGDPFHMGMRALRRRGFVASGDTNLVINFRRAGLAICGKTNLPELAMGPTTEPLAYGPTHNPWDLTRTPGGSSGGSAAAVAAGMVPAAHGNDMGGSLRIPASFCGLVALKATRARMSLGPDLGELWGPVTNEGVLTRTVRDCALLLDVAASPWPGDPYAAAPPARPYVEEVGADPGHLRVGLCPALPDAPVDPACRSAVENTGRLLEEAGHQVELAFPPALEEPVMAELSGLVWGTGVRRDVDRLGEKLVEPIDLEELEPLNRTICEEAASVTASRYLGALEQLYSWGRRVMAWWVGGFDLLVTPTSTRPAPPLGLLAPDTDLGQMTALIGELTRYVAPFNATGQPAVSLPLGWTDEGLPLGVQLVAGTGREDLLLRVAAFLEEACPWSGRRPLLQRGRDPR